MSVIGKEKEEDVMTKYVYGNTPGLLKQQISLADTRYAAYDAVVLGIPWEGGVTWEKYAGTELSPKAIRNASARYTGYLPELDDVNIWEKLTLCDIGDLDCAPCDTVLTFDRIERKAQEIFSTNTIPIFLGGDHSITYPIIRGLSNIDANKKIGIIHMDAHFDNRESFFDDPYARCCPLARIAEIPCVKNDSIVHFGIRGARNDPRDGAFAKKIGAKVITMNDIRMGDINRFFELVETAYAFASKGTDAVYVTVCSDVLDAAYNPGGPLDGNGLTTFELFNALYRFAKKGIVGFDVVEIYPPADINNTSSHIAVQMILYVLAGVSHNKSNLC